MRPTLAADLAVAAESGPEMTHRKELLVGVLAKRDGLRRDQTGIAAPTTKPRIHEIERELESRGVDLEAPKAGSSRLAICPTFG